MITKRESLNAAEFRSEEPHCPYCNDTKRADLIGIERVCMHCHVPENQPPAQPAREYWTLAWKPDENIFLDGPCLKGRIVTVAVVTQSEEQLRAEVERLRSRLCISPQGDDNIDALESAMNLIRAERDTLKLQLAESEEKLRLAEFKATNLSSKLQQINELSSRKPIREVAK